MGTWYHLYVGPALVVKDELLEGVDLNTLVVDELDETLVQLPGCDFAKGRTVFIPNGKMGHVSDPREDWPIMLSVQKDNPIAAGIRRTNQCDRFIELFSVEIYGILSAAGADLRAEGVSVEWIISGSVH